jgi:hypothetical protein
VLGAVHVAAQSSGAAVAAATDTPVTFGGNATVTIPAGGSVASDSVAFKYSFGSVLAVTSYVTGSWSSLSQHNYSALVTSYMSPSGSGNETGDLAGTSFTQTTGEVFLLDRLDVFGNYQKTVAVSGSSTTEGFGSDPNQFDDWVDEIADNLHAAGHDDIAVVNVSLTPDSLLAKNDLALNPSLTERFARDVLSLPGLATLLENTGDVDLKAATCSPATDVIAGKQAIIAQAHAAGVRVLLAIEAPSTFCDGQNPGGFGTRFPAGSGQDGQRQLLNSWMTSTQSATVSGVVEQPPGADGIVDISTPITDPSNTGYMLPKFDTGDDSHVNAAGQLLQAGAVPLNLL